MAHESFEDMNTVSSSVRLRKISCTELIQTHLDRINQDTSSVSSFVQLDEIDARAQAFQLDRLLNSVERIPITFGIPVGRKDIFCKKNHSTRAGSKVLDVDYATTTAPVLDNLAKAKSIDLGRLHTAEFALSPTGYNEHFGSLCNPWNSEHVVGGSSSGSAVAVARGYVFAALGTDTGGSIRHPAAMCGVSGLKPTNGVIDQRGVLPVSPSLDCIGPLARSARDCLTIFNAIQGKGNELELGRRDQADPRLGARSDYRIAIVEDYFFDDIDPEIESLIRSAVSDLATLGIRIAINSCTDMNEVNEKFGAILAYEAYEIHQEWIEARPELYSQQVRERILLGQDVTRKMYRNAIGSRSRIQREFVELAFRNVDAIVLPCVPIATPLLGEDENWQVSNLLERNAQITRCTRGINYLGLPALSIPCGFTRKGLPVAFQIVGKPHDEALICQISDIYQQRTFWHGRVPPIPEQTL